MKESEEYHIHIASLISKYVLNDLNSSEVEELENWVSADERNEERFRHLLNEAEMERQGAAFRSADTEAALIRAKQGLEFSDPLQEHAGRARTVSFGWMKIAAAAVFAAMVIGAGLFYYSNQQIKNKQETAVLKNDVAPGKVGATLTLSSGKKIKLSDAVNGKLADEAGVSVSKSADGQLVYELKDKDAEAGKVNTLSTANGETYQVRLPDGSMVWLNAASTLTYAANLDVAGKRSVKLSGEGYFEIAKDASRPFVVESDHQSVEVLGTHFNINTYADEPEVKTTLLEGSIRLNGKLMLRPGMQAVMNANYAVSVKEVNVNKAVAWKNGKFVFTSEPLESIMRKLARWYDVEVVYEAGTGNMPFTGSMSRADNISKILDVITMTQHVNFKIEGRRVTVTK